MNCITYLNSFKQKPQMQHVRMFYMSMLGPLGEFSGTWLKIGTNLNTSSLFIVNDK
jgi:hypothetical protein